MVRFDYLRFEPPKTVDRPPPENPTPGDGREIIDASIWEELVRKLSGLLEEERQREA